MTWASDMYELECFLVNREREARECVIDTQVGARSWFNDLDSDDYEVSEQLPYWQRNAAQWYANAREAYDEWAIADARLQALLECKRRYTAYVRMANESIAFAELHPNVFAMAVAAVQSDANAKDDFAVAMKSPSVAMGIG